MNETEFTGTERRYLLKKVKADIQSGNATSGAKLTMLFNLERKLSAKQIQPKEPEPCRNCGERVEPLDKDSPHSFCPSCYS